jgi:hypothetical protein
LVKQPEVDECIERLGRATELEGIKPDQTVHRRRLSEHFAQQAQ